MKHCKDLLKTLVLDDAAGAGSGAAVVASVVAAAGVAGAFAAGFVFIIILRWSRQ